MSDSTSLRDIIGKNLTELMKSDMSLNTLDKVATKSGVGRGTVDRMKKADVAVTVDTLEAIANTFKLQPWQLLIPNLIPSNPPVLQPQTATERELYKRLLSVARDLIDQGDQEAMAADQSNKLVRGRRKNDSYGNSIQENIEEKNDEQRDQDSRI